MFFFFFNDTATTEIYTLSLHDALPISLRSAHGTRRQRSHREAPGRARAGAIDGLSGAAQSGRGRRRKRHAPRWTRRDRKSTRLNSSHLVISYAVFCLKKKRSQYLL